MIDFPLILLLILLGSIAVFHYKNEETCDNDSNKNCSGINECCNRHSQCCSQYCEFSHFPWTKGYCMDPSNIIEVLKLQNKVDSKDAESECQPNGYNWCSKNEDCCSKFCFNNDRGMQYGECRSNGTDAYKNTIRQYENEPFDEDDEIGTCYYYVLSGNTASGEPYRKNDLTAAHRTLPFNTTVLVKYNGRQVVVRINDRGPPVSDRILDLSLAAARKVHMDQYGIGLCHLQVQNTKGRLTKWCQKAYEQGCVENNDCCSNNCVKSTNWATGYCQP